MSAEILSEPEGLVVLRQGRGIGKTPLKLELLGLEEAVMLSVDNPAGKVLERRIQVLSPQEVRILLKLSDQPSDLAKALGLTDVLVFDYGERATFQVDSYELSLDLLPVLKTQSEILVQRFAGIELHICGHSDSSGGDDYNRILSVRRAQSVADALIDNGVPAERLEVQGFGPDYPLAPNTTREGRSVNRRTEIVLGQ